MADRPTVNYHVRYACWGLLPSHVRVLRPQWSESEALDFLIKHQHRLAREVERVAWLALAAVLDEDERKK